METREAADGDEDGVEPIQLGKENKVGNSAQLSRHCMSVASSMGDCGEVEEVFFVNLDRAISVVSELAKFDELQVQIAPRSIFESGSLF